MLPYGRISTYPDGVRSRAAFISSADACKLRVALSPTQPNWMFTPLVLSAHGLRTGSFHGKAAQSKHPSTCSLQKLLSSAVTVSNVGSVLCRLDRLRRCMPNIALHLRHSKFGALFSPIPQELADVTPFHDDHRQREYDPSAVQRWFHANTTAQASLNSGGRTFSVVAVSSYGGRA